jgi:hypothetical protein
MVIGVPQTLEIRNLSARFDESSKERLARHPTG